VSAVLITPSLEPHVDWTAPAALWNQFDGPANAEQRNIFRTPAILRFATDAYMDELMALMKSDPHAIAQRLAVPEKWSKPVSEAAPVRPKRGLIGQIERARTIAVRKLQAREELVRSHAWNFASAQEPLKLYQPAAQRYYVVTACLVCRTLGLPDRPVNTAMDERVAFVLRMLETPDDVVNPDPRQHGELAFVDGAWKPVTSTAALEEGEELYLMSPFTYVEDDGRKRRMLSGVIPVAKREHLLGASRTSSSTAPQKAVIGPQQMALKLRVVGPWASLDDTAFRAAEEAAPGPGVEPTDADYIFVRDTTLANANNQIQGVSWLILLDLAQWLAENALPLWEAVTLRGRNSLSDARHRAAYDQLDRTFIVPASHESHSLITVLRTIEQHRPGLENATVPYPQPNKAGWPERFQFVTADAVQRKDDELKAEREARTAVRTAFENALVAAIVAEAPPAPVPLVAQMSASTSSQSPWFTVRCVYDRPKCGVLAPSVVSEPTASFQLASFFDPDAPARPIRVEMPQDTTPAGLRKHDKNTAFVMSDILCGQFGAIRGMTFGNLVRSVLPFPFKKDLNLGSMAPCPDGMICSFSIPIITICALILLMIIVKLLDIVFFWMPFFQICLPIPSFKGKGES
jgi:hypothetical protein